MAVLGLRFCARAFSSCGKWGPLFIAVRGPLTVVASLVAEHRLQTRRLSNCGSQAQLLRGTWDLPRPGLEPVSPALAGRFLTTAPPGKPGTATFERPHKVTEVIWRQVLFHMALADRYKISIPIINSSAASATYSPIDNSIKYVLSAYARGSLLQFTHIGS